MILRSVVPLKVARTVAAECLSRPEPGGIVTGDRPFGGRGLRDYTRLVVYVREDLNGGHEYDDYRPRLDLLRQIAALLPEARVKVVTAGASAECRREVARFARILKHLGGWDATIVEHDPGIGQRLAITQLPTFIIRSV